MKKYREELQKHFETLIKTGKLFQITNIPKFWDMYLSAFKDDPIFRDPNSSTHNCNICNSFIRRYANIIAINEKNEMITLFDFIPTSEEFIPVNKTLSKYLKSLEITEVFIETFNELNSLPYEKVTKKQEHYLLGTAYNFKIYNKEEAEKFGKVKEHEQIRFDHMSLSIPKNFIFFGSESKESLQSKFRADFQVFKRAMEEISLETLNLVRDLINQGSLLNGDAYLHKLNWIIPLKEEYDKLPQKKRNNWCWVNSYQQPFAKFKNELIGTLCSDLSTGVELNKACLDWNKRADPANYMKVTAPITKKQIEEAKKFVEENGYEDSFNRRTATLEDIKTSEILHINAGDGSIKNVSIFDSVKSTATRHKKSEFDSVEVVPIDKFMEKILPTCTGLSAYLLNSHVKNMVTLTTANQKDSKLIFKWDNNYSWTYEGNLAGKSEIKEAVKSRGGNVEAVVRVSIHFPNTTDDYDLHCSEPKNNEISYSTRRVEHPSSGMLDLDAQGIDGHFPPEKRVENITYTDKSRMPLGTYNFYVHNFSAKKLHTSFNIEVEIEGEISSFEFIADRSVNSKSFGKLKVTKDEITFVPENCVLKESQIISKEIYGLESNQFHKVNLMCLSPNFWDKNSVGNKHYFFFLDQCVNSNQIRSFHNENLNSDLLSHKKVMEVLGNQCMIIPGKKHLSGLGFNATVRDEIILKLEGSHKRVIKVQF